MVYPYYIQVDIDSEIDKILTKLAKHKTITLPINHNNKNIFKQLSKNLKPIRRQSIFMGDDCRFYEKNISIKDPLLKIDIETTPKYKNFIFKY